jgi:hypothetical protein
LPMYIWKQPNGRYRDTKTGRWISDAELQKYSNKPNESGQEIKHSPSHEEIILKRWDLNKD